MENHSTEQQRNNLGELLILSITVLPMLYLYLIYGSLPDEVPMHWNFKGEVDSWGAKSNLWIIILLMNVPIYLLMLFLPKFAAKKENIELMGKKYYRLRLILQLFMSALVTAIIFASSGVSDISIELLMGYCFAGFMILFGNYMGSIRQNHFMGIRTPWTLENEEVWKKTHHLGGRLWFVGGFVGILLMAVLPGNWALMTIIILMIVPMILAAIYSYILFQKVK